MPDSPENLLIKTADILKEEGSQAAIDYVYENSKLSKANSEKLVEYLRNKETV